MTSRVAARDESPFQVPAILDVLGGLVARHPELWITLAGLETRALSGLVQRTPLRAPIYISGLARSGSTLLHEIIAAAPGVATHRIKDYPLVFTPVWWRRANAGRHPASPRERAHADRILITAESPDALEEMVWRPFFPRCHDPSVSAVIPSDARDPVFEAFYKSHLRKVVAAEQATRYVAKANYHVARLAYLVRVIPDARFIIPIRDPETHVVSLMRQHVNFRAGQRRHRRALEYMRRSGHFEFGLDRRPIHLGDAEMVYRTQAAWRAGDEALGAALCWAVVYGYLARLLADDPLVRAASLVVRFESMCRAPAQTLHEIAEHCQLSAMGAVIERYATEIRAPSYYQSELTEREKAQVRATVAETASLWGYSVSP